MRDERARSAPFVLIEAGPETVAAFPARRSVLAGWRARIQELIPLHRARRAAAQRMAAPPGGSVRQVNPTGSGAA